MLQDNLKHLLIDRAITINERRSGRKPKYRYIEDVPDHGKRIRASFQNSFKEINRHRSEYNDSLVIKVSYQDALDFNSLKAHGVDFISQEGSNLFIGFLDAKGLNKFTEHLEYMTEGKHVTYLQVLKAFESIDAWGPEDKKSWAIRNGSIPEGAFRIDVELWPIEFISIEERKKYCKDVLDRLKRLGADIIDSIVLDSLLMFRLSVNESIYNKILKEADVRYIDFPPASGISYQAKNIAFNPTSLIVTSPDKHSPKICILDSGINTNHPLLAPAIAESASFVDSGKTNDDIGHGTQVAGIALYGDFEARVESGEWRPDSWIYNGRILDDNGEFDELTIENTLINAIEYFVDCGCKIFNISIGNANAPYQEGHIKGMAYVLDELARKHDLLFIISAGNFLGSEDPPIPQDSWREEYPDYLSCEFNRIIDPAPSLNSITVGGLAKHNATINSQNYPDDINQLAAANRNQPSPFTRRGPSIRGAIKPDLVAYAGNLACPMRDEGKQWQKFDKGIGVLTCNHSFVAGTLLCDVSGTSFSSPYVTYLASRVLKEYPDASANLIRCLLFSQSEDLIECKNTFSDSFSKEYSEKHGARRSILRDISGLGIVSEENLYRSSDDVVVLMAEDKIENNKCHFYEIPIPDEYLRKGNSSREIKVALSYMPAVRTTRADYRATKISFNLVNGESLEEVERYYNKNYQHELSVRGDSVHDKNRRKISSELRSKGTGQLSRWVFKRMDQNKKWFVVVTRQDSYGWGDLLSDDLEGYAIVITLADRENAEANLYLQVKQRANIRERINVGMQRVKM